MKQRVERQAVEVVNLSLGPGGRTLRLALSRDEAGTPKALVVMLGYGDGDPFTRPPCEHHPPLRLPGQMIPILIEALEALTGENER